LDTVQQKSDPADYTQLQDELLAGIEMVRYKEKPLGNESRGLLERDFMSRSLN
jgi:hypothetical protein